MDVTAEMWYCMWYVMATCSEAIIRDYNKILLCTVIEYVETGLF